MKKIIPLISILCLALFCPAQEITEKNYLKADREIWEKLDRDIKKLAEKHGQSPEGREAFRAEADELSRKASAKNRELAMKYASVPSGLKRLYMVRLTLPKARVREIFESLPKDVQNSPYGKTLAAHLNSKQISEDDACYDFEATDSEGGKFKLSAHKGKNVLFIYGGYGGLSCMGKSNRDFLNSIYNKNKREDFEIVVFCSDSNQNKLKKVRETYPCEFIIVSDFLEDHSPVKIIYGAQVSPTCFFINKQGVVEMKTMGLEENRISELLTRTGVM